MHAGVPPGGTCGTKPCWKALGSVGFKYSDKVGTAGGISKVLLKSGAVGHGKISVKGRGANLQLPSGQLATPVKVQVRQDASTACWEATYTNALVDAAGA